MKVKTVISLLLAAALSATMCIGLAACGEEKDSGQKQPDTPVTPVTPEKLVSDKVTQAEWDAAFADGNFANVKVEMSGAADEKWHDEGVLITGTGTSESLYLSADGKEYFKSYVKWVDSKDGTSEQREEKYISKGYLYGKNSEGKWTAEEAETTLRSEAIWYSLGSGYEMFTYSEEEGAYIATHRDEFENSSYIDATFIVKIKDGKLLFFEHRYKEGGPEAGDQSTSSESFTFTYGGQTVTLPANLPETEE